MHKDPVCGMSLDDDEADETSTFSGKTYYFCSPDCKSDFDEAPEDYTDQEEESVA